LTVRDLTLAHGRSPASLFNGGGAIINQNGTVIADGVRFEENGAESTGGAIWSRGPIGTLVVTDSTFVDNVAFCNAICQDTGGGGAISVIAGGPTTITGSSFVGNRISSLDMEGNDLGFGRGGGGAILGQRTFSEAQAGPIEIVDSTFTGNMSSVVTPEGVFGGGAVKVHNHELTITGSAFRDNAALDPREGSQVRGGAVLVASEVPPGFEFQPKPALISDSEFTGNQGDDGGAIHAVTRREEGADYLPLKLEVVDSVLSENTGSSSGAIQNTLAMVEITDTLITGNEATGESIQAGAGGVSTIGNGASTSFAGTTLLDNEGGRGNCSTNFEGLILNDGGNTESPGNSCGFGSRCAGLEPTIMGYGGIAGTRADDVLVGLGGADQELRARAGDDAACGGEGNDRIAGGRGKDTLRGEGGDDVLSGGPGADELSGGSGDDVCRARTRGPARAC
jgi:hypothetical protein